MAINEKHRQLVLRPGKAETDTFLAGKQRSFRELVDDGGQLPVFERAVIEVCCLLDRPFARMCEGNSAGAFPANRIEQREIVAS
jgi:hypothetical protein